MLRTSHILCKVDDVRAVVRDYQKLGFTVEYGSAPERAHNALLWFPEGPFIEFFQLPPAFRLLKWPMSVYGGSPAGARLTRWARRGTGWCDLALETSDTRLDAARAALRAGGVRVSRAMGGKRTRPDGQLVRYQFLAASPDRLPFVVSSYDPPQRPLGIRHANGARRISAVHMEVAEADRPAFDTMTHAAALPADDVLRVASGPRTRVVSVELSGLTDPVPDTPVHGAVLTAAARKE
ncbi:VOC family protein [Streptomyces sulphureus]|uniref:VOC family protein n=1 Tax=Streptomyces sulphureus TaxID=47758 RepID=UPI00036FD588|nr:VOC family protein [Streptomyces sulphureus]